jgi:hypothetical protein
MWIVVFTLVLSIQVWAGEKKWDSLNKIEEAWDLKTGEFYSPKDKSGHKELEKGEKIMKSRLPTAVKMEVVGGKFWVLQESGTEFVMNSAGEFIRRWDCGNQIDSLVHLFRGNRAPRDTTKVAPLLTPPPSYHVDVTTPVTINNNPYWPEYSAKKGSNKTVWYVLGGIAVGGLTYALLRPEEQKSAPVVVNNNITINPTPTDPKPKDPDPTTGGYLPPGKKVPAPISLKISRHEFRVGFQTSLR